LKELIMIIIFLAYQLNLFNLICENSEYFHHYKLSNR
jgi:hypothetical protein